MNNLNNNDTSALCVFTREAIVDRAIGLYKQGYTPDMRIVTDTVCVTEEPKSTYISMCDYWEAYAATIFAVINKGSIT